MCTVQCIVGSVDWHACTWMAIGKVYASLHCTLDDPAVFRSTSVPGAQRGWQPLVAVSVEYLALSANQ